MTYKEAKRISLANYNLKFRVADIYKNTGSFSKQYKEARRTRKRLVKV
jgi:hypothetical protein